MPFDKPPNEIIIAIWTTLIINPKIVKTKIQMNLWAKILVTVIACLTKLLVIIAADIHFLSIILGG